MTCQVLHLVMSRMSRSQVLPGNALLMAIATGYIGRGYFARVNIQCYGYRGYLHTYCPASY
jgi:hypothetical protein